MKTEKEKGGGGGRLGQSRQVSACFSKKKKRQA